MTKQTETILNVTGMSCGACVRHVDGALRGLPGVTKVDVQLDPGRVRVSHDLGLAPVARLIDAIVDAGYQASEPA